MDRELDTDRLAPWLELLVASGDEHLRDRLLLECALATNAVTSAALWREVTGFWREVLARGPREDLPDSPQVEALRSGALAADVLGTKRVITFGRVALALGGVRGDDEVLDALEALVCVFAHVEAARGGEAIPAALPGGRPVEPAVDATEDRRLRHDLANVLTSLAASERVLDELGSGLSLEETRHYRSIVEHETGRAGELLATAFVRRAVERPGSCRVAEVLERALAAERPLLEAAGITLEVLVDPSVRGRDVGLHASDLSRVLQNLFVNAREALGSTSRGRIWVTLEARPECVRLIVEDDGPGLPPQDPECVFQTGFSTKSRQSDGQGLSIVRDLIETAGGSVRGENRVSGGARFDMTIPPPTGASS